MGNCVTPIGKLHVEEENKKAKAITKHDQKLRDNEDKGGLKLRITVTKEELEWLMYELHVSGGEKQVEDVLREMEMRRRPLKKVIVRGCNWKPSLESILESIEGTDELESLTIK